MEDPRNDAAGLLLLRLRDGALRLERVAQLGRHHEDSALEVLGRAGVEADDPGLEVDLTPLECEHLAPDAPASDVGERDDGLRVGGRVGADGFVLAILEEAGPDVVLLQHRDVRGPVDLLALDRQGEHPLEGCELPIDSGVRRALRLARGLVGGDVGAHHLDCGQRPEDREQVLDRVLDPVLPYSAEVIKSVHIAGGREKVYVIRGSAMS